MEKTRKELPAELALLVDAYKTANAVGKPEKPATFNRVEAFLNSDRKSELLLQAFEAGFAKKTKLTAYDFLFLAVAKPRNNKTNVEDWTMDIIRSNIELVTALAVYSVKEKGSNSSVMSKWVNNLGSATIASYCDAVKA